MNALTMLLKIFKNPRTLMGIGFLILIVAIYFMGPRIGLRGMNRLITVGVLLVLWLILQIVLWVRANKSKKEAEDLEASLIIEADENVAQASAAQKQAKEEARKELVSAVELLKKSALAEGRGGKAALYALPWYMVLGSADSGKSSMIRNSGLQKPDQGPGELKGIGSSPNCEWWFTNQAVVLEADRRFVVHDENRQAENGWATFLQLLGKHRSNTPLNGVVVTISATELLQGSAGEMESLARLLRRRLDAMRTQLKQVFPIYVVITKLDLVHGFQEFFHGLDEKASAQILGATLRGKHMRHPEPEKVCDAEFQALFQTLAKRRGFCLVRETDQRLKTGSYLFPLEFHRLRANLKGFVRSLGEANAYGASPLFRGFYFTSAGGSGKVSDVVLTEVSQVIGLPGVGATPAAQAAPDTGPTRPFFLYDFFRGVLVPDRTIARPTRGAARKSHVMRRTLQYAALAAMVFCGVMMTVSFGRNLALINETKVLAANAANVTGSLNALPEIGQALSSLDALRLHLERLDQLDEHRSPAMALGFYRGNEVNAQARQIYLERLREVLVIPSRKELELYLERPVPAAGDQESNERFYNRYRVYRMLFSPPNGDPDLISGELQRLWTDLTGAREVRDRDLTLINDHIRYAQQHSEVFNRYCGAKNPDPALKQKGNAYMRANWRAETYYNNLVSETNRKVPAFGLDAARHRGLTALETIDGAEKAVTVPGSFTQGAWAEWIREGILNSDEKLKEDWLLREVFQEQSAGILTELIMFYEKDYASHWNHFLSTVDFPRQTSLNQATSTIVALRDTEAPFYVLLEEASTQLRFDEDEGDVGKEIEQSMSRVQKSFYALHSFVDNKETEDGASPPQEAFQGVLQEIWDMLIGLRSEDELIAAAGFTRTVFEDPRKENQIKKMRDLAFRHCNASELGSAPSNKAVQTYLARPAAAAWRACLGATADYLDREWQSQVRATFESDLKPKYPFTRAQTSVALADFSDFFGPGGRMDKFVTEQLAGFLESDRTARQVYDDGLALGETMTASLRRGDDFRQILFDAGGELGVHCDLTALQIRTVAGNPPRFIGSQVRLGQQKLIYDNGPPLTKRFVWPDEAGSVPARVFVLCGSGDCDNPAENRVESDEWSFFRLLDQSAMPDNASRKSEFEIKWEQEGSGKYRIAVPYRLKADSARHPFWPGFLRFQCPSRLSE
jgi:type VI secretion system protein ImpL